MAVMLRFSRVYPPPLEKKQKRQRNERLVLFCSPLKNLRITMSHLRAAIIFRLIFKAHFSVFAAQAALDMLVSLRAN